MREWAADNAPTCGRVDHEAFCDFWRSKPGAAGRKVDWVATWRNWMRKEHERRAARGARASPNGRRDHDQEIRDFLSRSQPPTRQLPGGD
jgi:hypothetical protein